MGNAPSSLDAPARRALANKLVKSRSGNPAAADASSGQLRPDDEFPEYDEMRFFSSTTHPGLILAGGHPSRRFTLPPVPSPSSASLASPSIPFHPLRDDDNSQLLSIGGDDISDSTNSTQQRKERNRRSIFRSRSSSAKPSRNAQPESSNTTTGTAKPLPPIEGQGVAPSRHNSLIIREGETFGEQLHVESWRQDNRVSWHYDLKSYEAKRLLNFVQDSEETVPYDCSNMSETKFSNVSEATWKSSHPTQHESAPISRANSDLSLYTPVRRRSIIQTPGVATRRNSVKGPLVTQRYSHPPTPSLSRQASFESHANRVKSMPSLPPVPPLPLSLPHSRDANEPLGLVTPCEGDYQTIGAFKLGTLRIMNGCASPVPDSPEPAEKRRIRGPVLQEPPRSSDYFTMSSTKVNSAASMDLAAQAVASGGQPDPQNLSEDREALQFATHLLQCAPALTLSPDPMALSQPSPNLGEKLTPREIQLTTPHFSPFLVDQASPTSPLQTTSKINAVEDSLFEDDTQPEYSTVEVLNLRLDPNAKREYPKKEELAQSSVNTIARTDSGFVSTPTSEQRSYKALSKTDSGYSSNVSLRSLRSGSSNFHPDNERSWSGAKESRQFVTLARETRFKSTVASPVEIQLLAAEMESVPPPPPPKDYSPAQSQRSVPRVPIKPSPFPNLPKTTGNTYESTTSAHRRSTFSPSQSRTWEVVSGAPSSPLSPLSQKSDSSMSLGRPSQRSGRLQRLLSIGSSGRSHSSLMVHKTHGAGRGDIPAVPREMRRNLRTHSQMFPISSRKLALRSQKSKDTLKTIISVGSMEVRSALADTVPHKASSPEPASRKHTFTPSSLGRVSTVDSDADAGSEMQRPIPREPVRTMSIPRKPVPIRKWGLKELPTVQKEERAASPKRDNVLDAEAKLLSYTSVNSSLGNPPYDAGAKAIARNDDGNKDLRFSTSGRTMSLTHSERSWSIKNWAAPSPSLSGSMPRDCLESGSPPAPPSPLIPEVISRKKYSSTPPPVSMKTRKHANLRVPPLLRPQSTPPVRSQSTSPSSRRTTSHESLRIDTSGFQYFNATPPAPVISSARPVGSFYRSVVVAPDWRVKTDHDTSQLRRRLSIDTQEFDHHQFSLDGGGMQGPYPVAQNRQDRPSLQHRASHDGFSQHRNDYQTQHSVHYGAQHYQRPMVKQSSSPIADPRWNWSLQQHWDHQDRQLGGRYRPYVPRGHHRNNSMSSLGPRSPPGVPYRILHSYNSPAYRNAPIWG